jgi:hypothetical protein
MPGSFCMKIFLPARTLKRTGVSVVLSCEAASCEVSSRTLSVNERSFSAGASGSRSCCDFVIFFDSSIVTRRAVY